MKWFGLGVATPQNAPFGISNQFTAIFAKVDALVTAAEAQAALDKVTNEQLATLNAKFGALTHFAADIMVAVSTVKAQVAAVQQSLQHQVAQLQAEIAAGANVDVTAQVANITANTTNLSNVADDLQTKMQAALDAANAPVDPTTASQTPPPASTP